MRAANLVIADLSISRGENGITAPDLKRGSQKIHAEWGDQGKMRKVAGSGNIKMSPAPAILPSELRSMPEVFRPNWENCAVRGIFEQ